MVTLITGGAGYIGSHTCVALLNAGQPLLVLDNLSNSNIQSLKRVEKITQQSIVFVKGDVRDKDCLRALFSKYAIHAVMHFAGLKAVGESVNNPLMYYDNNVAGSLALTQVMAEFGVKNLVFSSSATVYDTRHYQRLSENTPQHPSNPYGQSKRMVEQMLRDIAAADPAWRIAILRYFNPVGAHASGLIGEDPKGVPNNLMPYIAQVAVGHLPALTVFGSDYATLDGTGVRDYIHVVDLAEGHVAALNALKRSTELITVNLGTGVGYSVLQLLKAFEEVSGKAIPYHFAARRAGDVDSYYADASLAATVLGWKAKLDVRAMCQDVWRWQTNNPQGYATTSNNDS
jgi:UDP-glucose 4-epimerase